MRPPLGANNEPSNGNTGRSGPPASNVTSSAPRSRAQGPHPGQASTATLHAQRPQQQAPSSTPTPMTPSGRQTPNQFSGGPIFQSIAAHAAERPRPTNISPSLHSANSSRLSTYGIPGLQDLSAVPRPNYDPRPLRAPPQAPYRTPNRPAQGVSPDMQFSHTQFLPFKHPTPPQPRPPYPANRPSNVMVPPQPPNLPPTLVNIRAPPQFPQTGPRHPSYPAAVGGQPNLFPGPQVVLPRPPLSTRPTVMVVPPGVPEPRSVAASPLVLSPNIESRAPPDVPVHLFIPVSPPPQQQMDPSLLMVDPRLDLPSAPPRQIVYEQHVIPVRHIHEKIVEIPEIEIQEKIFEYPQIVIEEKVVEVARIHTQDRIFQVPRTHFVEKVVEVPEIEYRINQHERVVELPQIAEQEIIKEVEVPVTVEVPVPQVVKVQVPVEIKRNIPFPVEVIARYPFKEVKHLKVKEKQIPLPIYVPRFIETPMMAEDMGTEQFQQSVELNTRLSQLSQQSHVLQQQLQELLPLAEPIGRISTGAPKTAYAPPPPPLASENVLMGEGLFFPPPGTLPWRKPPFAEPPFAQPPFAQPPFAQPPFAQPPYPFPPHPELTYPELVHRFHALPPPFPETQLHLHHPPFIPPPPPPMIGMNNNHCLTPTGRIRRCYPSTDIL